MVWVRRAIVTHPLHPPLREEGALKNSLTSLSYRALASDPYLTQIMMTRPLLALASLVTAMGTAVTETSLSLADFEALLVSAGQIFAGNERSFQDAVAHRRHTLVADPSLRWTYLCRCSADLAELARLSDGSDTPVGGARGAGWYVATLTSPAASSLLSRGCKIAEPSLRRSSSTPRC